MNGVEVAVSENRETGLVKRWDCGRAFGFIRLDDGVEAFVHVSGLRHAADADRLAPGVGVQCEVVDSPRGPRAEDVTVIGR